MVERCLVTGANGFLGVELVGQLINRGFSVRALLLPDEKPKFQNVNVEIVFGNVCDESAVLAAAKNIDYVFHLASIYQETLAGSPYPVAMYETNVRGTENVCRVALHFKVRKLIYTSSAGTVGVETGNLSADETVEFNCLSRRSHYEKSKALAEKAALSYHSKGLSVVSLNPSFLIGPGDDRPTPTGAMILNYLWGKYPCYFDGAFHFSGVREVAKAHIDALERGRSGEKYLLCSDDPVTVRDFFAAMEAVSGIKRPRLKLPLKLLMTAGYLQERFLMAFGPHANTSIVLPYEILRYMALGCRYNNSKAKEELGYLSGDLKEILKDSVEWFRSRYDPI